MSFSPTLTDIRNLVRRLTGTPSPRQLSNDEIDKSIDTFYENDLPAHLKLWDLHQTYEFFTQPNIGDYTIDTAQFKTMGPPAYVENFTLDWYQSRQLFKSRYPDAAQRQTASANGTAGPYDITLTRTPVLRNQVTIGATDTSGNTVQVEDNGSGSFVVAGTTTPIADGSIDYETGAITDLTFNAVLQNGTDITIWYHPYKASRPRTILIFNNTFTLRPVPDKVYRVTVETQRRPINLFNSDNSQPDILQWWEYIAYGAARKILLYRRDTDTLASIEPGYQEQAELVLNKTVQQRSSQRAPSIYASNSGYIQNGGYYGGQF